MKRKDLEDEIINCFGELWDIEFDDDLLKNNAVNGEVLVHSNIIRLAPDDDPVELLHTLLHECFHVYSRRVGIIQGMSNELDETIAEGFSRFLVENFNISLKT